VLAALEPEEIAAFVLLDIAVIMVVARLMGALFRRLRQPPVVGEILAGILLGPTLLGRLPGNPTDDLFPHEVRPFLTVLAQLGLVIFMFIVGLELDMKLIRGKERVAAVISLTSVALPFALGILLATALHQNHDEAPGARDFLPFALFIGASMSVTAFPVLARILTERGMYRTAIGSLALACAAVDDILAWSLLAVVVAVVEASGVWDLPRILVLSTAFVAFSFLVVKPQLARVAARYRDQGRLTPNLLAVILAGILVSAFVTSEIGIHSIFGAFLFGAIMPREDTHELFREILERLEQVSVLLLLPVFFIATGFGVDVGGLTAGDLGELGLVVLAACAGKFIGAAAGARAQGIAPRKAAAIGILMNTRGLTELVILNIGVTKGVLDGELFTVLVIMAVLTTIVTEPLLRLVYPEKVLARDVAEAEREALGLPQAYRALVVLDEDADGEAGLDAAVDLVAAESPSEVVLSRFRPFPTTGLEVGAGLVGELDQLTASMEATNALVGRAAARGVRCVVLSRFSGDAAGDAVAQADSVDADVILLPAGGDEALAAAVLATAPRAVVRRGGPAGWDGPVVVPIGEGTGDDAALAVAVRVARGRGVPVLLVADAGSRRAARHAGALAERLRRAGVDAAVGDADGTAGLLVAPAASADGPPDRAALYVRAAEGDEGGSLDRLLERLGQEPAPPATTTGTVR
jgi:Kef-type K+ transport system membrane component KefB